MWYFVSFRTAFMLSNYTNVNMFPLVFFILHTRCVWFSSSRKVKVLLLICLCIGYLFEDSESFWLLLKETLMKSFSNWSKPVVMGWWECLFVVHICHGQAKASFDFYLGPFGMHVGSLPLSKHFLWCFSLLFPFLSVCLSIATPPPMPPRLTIPWLMDRNRVGRYRMPGTWCKNNCTLMHRVNQIPVFPFTFTSGSWLSFPKHHFWVREVYYYSLQLLASNVASLWSNGVCEWWVFVWENA